VDRAPVAVPEHDHSALLEPVGVPLPFVAQGIVASRHDDSGRQTIERRGPQWGSQRIVPLHLSGT
jgi:hypothetical protein